MGMLLVGRAQDLAFVWPGGAQQPFIIHTGYNVRHPSVAIVAPHLGVKWLKARRQNDRRYFYFDLLRFLLKIYGVIFTDPFANTTFLLFKVKAAFINICDKRNCLRVVYMDGFVLRYFLIKLIGVFNRAVFYTGSATCAFVLINVSGLFNKGYLEVSCFPCDTVNFS